MSLQTVYESLKQHFETIEAEVKSKLENDLPVVAEYAQKEASNPAIAALAAAVHLGEVPEFLQTIADMVTKADAAIAQSKAAGAAEATAAQQPTEPQPEPEPAPAG